MAVKKIQFIGKALLGVLIIFVLAGAAKRDRTPWVFRGVLDVKANILIAALHQDLWVAYDLVNGGLFRAWEGGIEEKGFHWKHPGELLPVTTGTRYYVTDVKSFWEGKQGGKTFPLRAQYKGHRLIGKNNEGQVMIRFQLTLPDKKIVTLEEIPEVIPISGKVPGFSRKLQINGLPKGNELWLRLNPDTPEEGLAESWKIQGVGKLVSQKGNRYLHLRQDGTVILTANWVAPKPK